MRHASQPTHWTRHLVYRSERLRPTWKLWLVAVVTLVGAAWLTVGWWSVAVARSLVCGGQPAPSDAILVENFESDYLVFERAAELRRNGVARRVLVPVLAAPNTTNLNDVALGISQVMVRIARLTDVEFVPMREVEPISLNAARDVLQFVERERIRSVVVVAPLFRSRRSALVYGEVFHRAGVGVSCIPARSTQRVDTWTQTWHGIEAVAEQWLKLQYYRLYVMPFRATQDDESMAVRGRSNRQTSAD